MGPAELSNLGPVLIIIHNVRIVAVAGGYEANGGCRITGIACRWQFGIPILHVDISI